MIETTRPLPDHVLSFFGYLLRRLVDRWKTPFASDAVVDGGQPIFRTMLTEDFFERALDLVPVLFFADSDVYDVELRLIRIWFALFPRRSFECTVRCRGARHLGGCGLESVRLH